MTNLSDHWCHFGEWICDICNYNDAFMYSIYMSLHFRPFIVPRTFAYWISYSYPKNSWKRVTSLLISIRSPKWWWIYSAILKYLQIRILCIHTSLFDRLISSCIYNSEYYSAALGLLMLVFITPTKCFLYRLRDYCL